jgi:hypothetical protein
MIRTPSMADVITGALDARLRDLHVALPARVERYDAAKQLVDVQPLLKEAHPDEDGEPVAASLPMIVDVPVCFPGAGGFRLTFPIQQGDTVLLVFAERSMDIWLERGDEVDPVDLRQHHLSDAVAIVGLHAVTKAWTGASTSNATIGQDGGLQIHFKPDSIALGSESATDAVAMAQKVLNALADLKTAISTALVTAAPDGGASFKAGLMANLASWPPSVGSAHVKVSD